MKNKKQTTSIMNYGTTTNEKKADVGNLRIFSSFFCYLQLALKFILKIKKKTLTVAEYSWFCQQ